MVGSCYNIEMNTIGTCFEGLSQGKTSGPEVHQGLAIWEVYWNEFVIF